MSFRTYRYLSKIKVFQERGKACHLDNITVTLHADHINCFATTPLHVGPVYCTAGVGMIDFIFAHHDRSRSRPVVPLVEHVNEGIGRDIIVNISDHTVRNSGRQTGWGSGRCDNNEFRVRGVDSVVDLSKP